MPVEIILRGYDFERLQFKIKAPCEVELDTLKEIDIISTVANQLIKEHKISPKRLKITCYTGHTNKRPKDWKYSWYDLKYGEDKNE